MKLQNIFYFQAKNRTFYLIAVLILLVAAAYFNRDTSQNGNSAKFTDTTPEGFIDVNPGELSELMDQETGLVIIDVRTPGEWQDGIAEEALKINLNAHSFFDEIRDLDPDIPYLIYCNSGNRSRVASKMMIDAGFSKVYNYNGWHTQIRHEHHEWLSE